MTSIFELSKEQQEILNLVENGDLTLEQVSDHLELLEMEVADKWNAYGRVNQLLNAQLDYLANEEKRIKQLKGEKQNEIKRLKQTLLAGMKSQDITKYS